MSDVEGVRHLNYQGDQTGSIGQIVGPDQFDGFWKIVAAEHVNGRTRVGLIPHADAWSRIKRQV